MELKTLFLGLHPPKDNPHLVHFPIIRIEPLPTWHPLVMHMMKKWQSYTHILFTSRSAVRLLAKYCVFFGCDPTQKKGIAVGRATAGEMAHCRFCVDYVAELEQAEGVVELLTQISLREASLLWPHSALARGVLSDYFKKNKLKVEEVPIYTTLAVDSHDPPDLNMFRRIIFTSPSTVDAFIKIYGSLPCDKELAFIGPITEKRLRECGGFA